MFGVGGMELFALVFLAIVVLGPNRMPEYAAKLARGIRQVRVMAEGAKGQLKEQLGPEYKDLDWRQYDPRQYDPRRIVRQALIEPLEEATAGVKDLGKPAATGASAAAVAVTQNPPAIPAHSYDPGRPTPFDTDAT